MQYSYEKIITNPSENRLFLVEREGAQLNLIIYILLLIVAHDKKNVQTNPSKTTHIIKKR